MNECRAYKLAVEFRGEVQRATMEVYGRADSGRVGKGDKLVVTEKGMERVVDLVKCLAEGGGKVEPKHAEKGESPPPPRSLVCTDV